MKFDEFRNEEEETANNKALARTAIVIKKWLYLNGFVFKRVVYDAFDLDFNILIEGVSGDQLDEVAQRLEEDFVFKVTVVDENIYLDTTEEYEDEFGDICTRAFRS